MAGDALAYAPFGALGAVVLAVYVRTVYSGVASGDSGELVQIAHELGVAHPPGYPLWTLAAHGFARAAWLGGSVAWRVNLSSAVFGAAAAALLAAAAAELSGCAAAGVAAGGLFAFSPHVWAYATQAEVFALHNLLLAKLLFLLVRLDHFTRAAAAAAAADTDANACVRALARTGALVIGLALSNQHTAILFAAPWAAYAVYAARHTARLHRPAQLGALCGCGLLGLAPYAHLAVRGGAFAHQPGERRPPLAARAHTPAWGSWGDTTTLRGFAHHVLRRDYGTFRLSNAERATDGEYGLRLRAYVSSLPAQALGPAGVALALLGTAALLRARRSRPLALALLASAALYAGPFFFLSNLPVSSPFYRQIQERFWPQLTLLVLSAAAVGLARVCDAIPLLLPPTPTAPPPPPAAAACAAQRANGAPSAWRWAVCALLVAAQACTHHAAHDASRRDLFTRFGWALLDCVPPPARAAPRRLSSASPAAAAAAAAALARGGALAGGEVAGAARAAAAAAAARAALPDLPAGRAALLLANGDEVINALRYAQRCEGHRRDVLIVDLNYMQFSWYIAQHGAAHFPDVAFPGTSYGNSPGAFQLDAFLRANAHAFDVYSAGGLLAADPSWQATYRLWPQGLLQRLVPRSARLELNEPWQRASADALLLPELRAALGAVSPMQPGSWEEVVSNNHLAQAVHARPYAVLQVALELGANAPASRDVFVLAARLYEEMVAASPHALAHAAGPPGAPVPDYVHRNIGVCYSRLIGLASDERERVMATQRAAAAFLRYLSSSTIGEADRQQVEAGLMGLIAPSPANPRLEGGSLTGEGAARPKSARGEEANGAGASPPRRRAAKRQA
ncbi:hypothetical protein KFE25_005466 [Diacronema lutheri]|uniref:DUF2723 domain-containing protein n=2 Tax=Diacronema lutheri TaxID=2081491 RepID=A0A8J5XC01_DIALT|nr:hypothetical protein KFE25_005466 [Diacronema lutheri]